MPRVTQVVDLHQLDPISTQVNRDVDGCIEQTVSDYGFVVHTVDITRDGNKVITDTDHTVADA